MNSTPLSPVDLVFTGRDAYPINFIFCYPYTIDAKRMKTALTKSIKKFWPLGSKLISDPQHTYRLERGETNVDFKLLPPRAEMPTLDDPKGLDNFIESVVTLPGESLAKFRLAYVGKASVFSASLSHALVDGYSYFFFLSVLAATYRNRPWQLGYWKQKALVPDLDRSKLCPSDASVKDSAIDPESVFRRTGLSYAEARSLPSLAESRWEFLRFSAADLSEKLKAASSETSVRLSKHDIITAMLWKKIAEQNTAEEVLECSSAFDYRRVYSVLSPLYFGNAVRAAPTRLPKKEVLSMSLGSLANQIRQATAKIDEAAVVDSLACAEAIRLKQGLEGLQRLHVSHPTRGLLVTNLSRLPAASLDFGQGGPERFVITTSAPRSAVLLSEGTDIVARITY